jgi:hypothetical protein
MTMKMKQTSASNSESTTMEGEGEGGVSDPDGISEQQHWPPSIPTSYITPLTNPAVRAWLRASKELVSMAAVRAEVS